LQFSVATRRADAIPLARCAPPSPHAQPLTSPPARRVDEKPMTPHVRAATGPSPSGSEIVSNAPATPRERAVEPPGEPVAPAPAGARTTSPDRYTARERAIEKPRAVPAASVEPDVAPIHDDASKDAASSAGRKVSPITRVGTAGDTPRTATQEPSVEPAEAKQSQDPPQEGEAAPPTGPARLIVSGPAHSRAGQQVEVTISVEEARGISHAPLRLRYDPAILEFASAREGKFMSAGGAQTVFMASPSSTPGLMFIAISRMPPAAGADGSGELCTLTFLAKAAGESAIDADGSRLLDRAARSIDMQRSDAHVVVQ